MKIVIWTGASWEPWDPSSLDVGGIGGSETAAIHMGCELAKLGHEVVLFGEHCGFEGHYNAVKPRDVKTSADLSPHVDYVAYHNAIDNPNLLNCDVFISSRDKRAHRLEPICRSKVLWVHDVNVGDDWESDLLSFDRIYCLSQWHKEYFLGVYSHVPPEVVSVTRNGIDVSRFHPEMCWDELAAKKKPNFVWSSSPDRGLDVMLDLWPQVREIRQDAELHIYYGFENWRKLNAENKRGLAIVNYMESRVHAKVMEGSGVFYHGRVGQRELAEAQLEAMVWGYPTAFHETSCITAMEAQAAGCIPVTTGIGALPETIKVGRDLTNTTDRKVMLEPNNKSSRYQKEFMAAVRAHLESWAHTQETNTSPYPGLKNWKEWQGTIVPGLAYEAREEGLKLGWKDVAEEWVRDFTRLSVNTVK